MSQILFSSFLKKGYEFIGLIEVPQNSSYWEWRDKVNVPLNWFEINLYKETDSLIDAIKKISPTHIVDFMGQGMVAQVGRILLCGTKLISVKKLYYWMQLEN